jgi:TRAP-type C4-dicarboxylate transport system substrate-binding protein
MFAARDRVVWSLETIGTAHLFSKLQIDSLDGFLSSRVWVPKGAHDVKYDEVGLKHPIPLDIRLLRDALRNDEIDTFTLTPTAALLKRYHTRVTVVSRQPLTYVVAPLYVHKESLSKLTPEDQGLVKEKLVQAFQKAARSNRDKDNEAMKLFAEREDLKVSDAIDYSQPAWQSWAENVRNRLANDKIVPKEMYEKAKRLLLEYRARTAKQ